MPTYVPKAKKKSQTIKNQTNKKKSNYIQTKKAYQNDRLFSIWYYYFKDGTLLFFYKALQFLFQVTALFQLYYHQYVEVFFEYDFFQ